MNSFQLYFNSYQEAVAQWEREIKHIVDEYRDNNLKYRQTPPPSYFEKTFEFSNNFKDVTYMFSSMKNVFMEDHERSKSKNEMINLIQNHYNSCTDMLDKLKSDTENETDDYIKSFRII